MGITAGTLIRAIGAGIIESKDIEELTTLEAAKIYHHLYYLPCRADQLNWPLDLVHFDSAVNHGIGGAGKLLQTTLNDINPYEFGPNWRIEVDGAVGPITLQAYDAARARVPIEDIARLYLRKRNDFYETIVRNRPAQRKFFKGWMNRLRWLKGETGLKE